MSLVKKGETGVGAISRFNGIITWANHRLAGNGDDTKSLMFVVIQDGRVSVRAIDMVSDVDGTNSVHVGS